jgi:hypothetical protein
MDKLIKLIDPGSNQFKLKAVPSFENDCLQKLVTSDGVQPKSVFVNCAGRTDAKTLSL